MNDSPSGDTPESRPGNAAPADSPQGSPRIGDSRPAPPGSSGDDKGAEGKNNDGRGRRNRKPRSDNGADAKAKTGDNKPKTGDTKPTGGQSGSGGAPGSGKRRRRRGGRGRGKGGNGGGGSNAKTTTPVQGAVPIAPVELDEETLEKRRGKRRKGKPVGRYQMCVHVRAEATQIAVLEGRRLIELTVSRPSDDVGQIHGNVYLGRVQNVLPGMEAAFVDIGTPKNAVLYRGDVQYDPDDIESKGSTPKIEDLLRAKQSIICQVTKNPIGAKGARLTQEVSLPGRFVVLVPNSTTYGISKRLSDNERKRLRSILNEIKPEQHGIIVRTAAEGITAEEIQNDVRRLLTQWDGIEKLAKSASPGSLLYREPDLAVRAIREEFSKDYRSVIIDDRKLYDEIKEYLEGITPALADRVQFYDPQAESLPLFERHQVHEQLHKATDRKVWLPSGGSLIIERTEALTVIDVNTGKNVGKSNLEDTVFKNNLEAAVEVAHQLRLRDIGGIIVIDFIDMEIKANRAEVVKVFKEALARDKTRTQVFDISELGLVEMTRKRIGEGLIESLSAPCEHCNARGFTLDEDLMSTNG